MSNRRRAVWRKYHDANAAIESLEDRTLLTQILVSETDGSTLVSENGGSDSILVQLDEQPSSDVVLRVSSGDGSEVAASTNNLTFNSDDWNIAQVVDVVGMSDNKIADGDVTVELTFSVDQSSTDSQNAFFDANDKVVSVINRSHITRTQFFLASPGRASDFIDFASTTDNADFDVELRDSRGNLLAPVSDGRVSLAGYPAGTYHVWANDDVGTYSIRPSPRFGRISSNLNGDIFAFDFDGSGDFSFSNDGIILLAHSLGSSAEQLEAFRTSGDTRSGAEIQAAIEELADSLDLDADGRFTFANDGVILLAFGLGTPAAQLEAFRGSEATRTGDQIGSRLDGLVRNQPPDPIDPIPDATATDDSLVDLIAGLQLALPRARIAADVAELDPTTAEFSLESSPGFGRLRVTADGGFEYAPNSTFHGVDSFDYRVTDASGSTWSKSVQITVRPDPADLFNAFADGVAGLPTSISGITNLVDINAPIYGDIPVDTVLDVQASLSDALPTLDLTSVTTMAAARQELEAAGFTIVSFGTEADLESARAGELVELFRVGLTVDVPPIEVAVPLDSELLTVDIPDFVNIDFPSSVTVIADISIDLQMGLDTVGFFVVPGDVVTADIDAVAEAAISVAGQAGTTTVVIDTQPVFTIADVQDQGSTRLAYLESDLSATEVSLTGRTVVGFHSQVRVGPITIPIDGTWTWVFSEDGIQSESDGTGIAAIDDFFAGLGQSFQPST